MGPWSEIWAREICVKICPISHFSVSLIFLDLGLWQRGTKISSEGCQVSESLGGERNLWWVWLHVQRHHCLPVHVQPLTCSLGVWVLNESTHLWPRISQKAKLLISWSWNLLRMDEKILSSPQFPYSWQLLSLLLLYGIGIEIERENIFIFVNNIAVFHDFLSFKMGNWLLCPS